MKLEYSNTYLNSMIEDLHKYVDRAYAPYSKFKVACALITSDKKVVKGVNVENASYGLTMCAERNAIATAIGMGIQLDQVECLIIYHEDKCISPCGACAQVISELLRSDIKIIMACNHEYKVCEGKELLPFQFCKEDLDEL